MSRQNQSFRNRRAATARKAVPPAAPVRPDVLPRAGVGLRLITLIYDGLLLIALTAVLNTLLIALITPSAASDSNTLTVLSPGVRYGLLFPATLLVIFAFYGYCWTRSGQTLGMQTWRLEVRRLDGNLMTWGDSLLRSVSASAVPAFCGLTSWLLRGDVAAFAISITVGFFFNYAWRWLPIPSAVSGRCLHDVLSHTDVLRRPAQPKQRKPYRFLGLFGDRQD